MESHSMHLREPLAGRSLMREQGFGDLVVLDGRVWMTRADDLDDHLLLPGDRLPIARSQHVVLEPWAGDAALVRFEPRPQPPRFAGLASDLLLFFAAAFGRAAAGLRRAEVALAARARSAAPNARCAQGCI